MSGDPDALGTQLYRAYRDAEPINLTALPSKLTIEEGYAAQDAFLDHRISAEGEPVGYKIGFTSEAVRTGLGVDAPAFGRLLADTVRDDRRFETELRIEPRIEPEIAFLIGDDLSPPVSRLDVLSATELLVPAIEIVDSRIHNWDLTGPTAIADNALAARLLIGDRIAASDVDLVREGVDVLIDGVRRATGTGAAVLGHPADAVAWLAETLSEHNETLKAGDIVTTGSITEPIPIEAGQTAVVRFSSLGSVVAHAE
ncbi:2-keto-4-pentenoate hydratase [Halalkalicoccus subterraneus]|uniref:2-keto-4-pentenoate hydratase n=1 Tax=Halalkalicoccus subterraneus TaxID=2675002 RepID=UPI000EFAFCF5|nr:fumarylacetoacetate hydrolase family protein [Halalkalicoccus subterraneus]